MALSVAMGITIALGVQWFCSTLMWFVLLLYLAFILATIMDTPVGYLFHRYKIPRGLSSTVILVLTLGLIATVLYFAATNLYDQFKDIGNTLQKLPDRINDWVAHFRNTHPGFKEPLATFDAKKEMKNVVGVQQLRDAAGAAVTNFPTVLETITSLVVMFFLTLYMSTDGGAYVKAGRRLIPKRARLEATSVFESICRAHRGWFMANFANVCSASILSSIGLMIVGAPAAIVLGVLAGTGEIIPNIGPAIAATPAVLVTLIASPERVPWVVLMFVIVQTIQGYGISPLVLKHGVSLPPLVTIIAVLAMGALFGLLGVIVAVPLTADLVVLWNYANAQLEKRETADDRDVVNDPPPDQRPCPPVHKASRDPGDPLPLPG